MTADAPKTIMTIPSGFAFLPKLAETLLADPTLGGAFDKKFALHDFTILLPHRRAVQALKAALLQQAEADALLMPDIRPLGEADDMDLIFSAPDMFDMPPCISDLARRNLLTTLVLKWGLRDGRLSNAVQAAKLASALMVFLDQAATEEISLEKMQNKDGQFVPQDFSTHWQQSLDFLDIIISAWPQIKKEMQVIEPPEARRLILQQQTDLLREQNADHARPIIAAGSTGSIPATARLLGAVAGATYGAVVLPALDRDMNAAAWDALADTPSHPQAGLFGLLKQLNVPREKVTLWPACADAGQDAQADRRRFLSAALLPAEQTGQWVTQMAQNNFDMDKALNGLTLLTGDDMWQEAGLIALAMREVLATPNKTAILVTPNRQLARHVAAQMRQWGVDIDDTAGQSLAQAPAGQFIRAVLETWADDFAPIGLLSVLKHDAAHCGADKQTHLEAVHGLDIFLRGKGVPASLADLLLLAQEDERGEKLRPFIENLMQHFAPLIDLPAQMGFDAMAAALVQVCDNLSRDAAGVAHIWQGADGRALENFLTELAALDDTAGQMNRHDWSGLITHWLASRPPVRRPFGQHPRLAIMGLLEARLVQADVMILGGLNETVWPPVPDTGPWVSRPMRAGLGMTSPERSIGLAAHDFMQAACAPCVILTRASKQEGSPMVAARWLTRMEAIVKGRLGADAALPDAPQILHYWQARDGAGAQKENAEQNAAQDLEQWLGAYHKPLPCPPASVRPHKISVTQIKTLQNNPYAIYARHILGLKRLDDLQSDADAAARGSFVHQVLEDFVRQYPDALPQDAAKILQKMARDLADDMAGGEDILRYWWARFVALSEWFADFESERRKRIEKIWAEKKGAIELKIGTQVFTLTGKADRIERHKNGDLHILDYKTGAVASQAAVATHRDMQMTLLGQIAVQGGFDGIAAGGLGGLAYIRTHGGFPAGAVHDIKTPPEMESLAALAQEAMETLHALLKLYANAKTPYAPHLGDVRYDDYEHLARVLEWSAGAEEAE